MRPDLEIDAKRVLDKGYVRLVDKMGDDLTIANAARVSYNKESHEMSDRDARLIDFLWREKHTSPFRHAVLSFEVYAPLFVARQWWKHHVASTGVDDQNAWNESSRRYVTEDPEFYIPNPGEWRKSPENSKQGSGGPLPWVGPTEYVRNQSLGVDSSGYGNFWTHELRNYLMHGERLYSLALEKGLAAEQARLFLPAYGLYVRWRWTTSLHGVLNFLSLRLPKDAQFEIQEYARAVASIVEKEFPQTWTAVMN